MANKYHKEKYTFRLINISKRVLVDFDNQFSTFQLKYEVGQYFKNKIKYVICIPYSKKIPSQKLLKFIKINKLKNYGLNCYLSTNRDNDGIYVPNEIVDFYGKMGGSLDFSFIFIDEE